MSKNQVPTRALKKTEVKRLETYMRGLETQAGKRDLAIFRTGIDSLLRVGDLLALKTDTILFDGEVRKSFQVIQMKMKAPVKIELGGKTITVLEDYLKSKDEQTEYVFTGRQSKKTGKPITGILWRKCLKHYCEAVGIDSKEISTHSIRKTIPTLLGNAGNIRAAQQLLNHKSLQHTMKYISVSETEAFDLKAKLDI